MGEKARCGRCGGPTSARHSLKACNARLRKTRKRRDEAIELTRWPLEIELGIRVMRVLWPLAATQWCRVCKKYVEPYHGVEDRFDAGHAEVPQSCYHDGEDKHHCPRCHRQHHRAEGRPNQRLDPIPFSRPTDKQLEAHKRKLLRKWEQSAEGRAERASQREKFRWLVEHRETPTAEERRAIETAYAAAVAAGFGDEPVEADVDPDNPFGWTDIEGEVVRLRDVEGLSFREIGKRRGGTSHVAAMKVYRRAQAKAGVVTRDTLLRSK